MPVWCPTCSEFHTDKIYHIALDKDGFGIVSPEVWQRLQECNSELELRDEVKKPPPIVLDFGAGPQKVSLYRSERN